MFPLLRTAALNGYPSLARSLGLDPNRLADAAGVSREAFTTPDLAVPISRVARLLEMSAEQAGIEDFGVRLGETRQISNLGLMGVIISEAPSPLRAIEAVARYVRLHSGALSLRLEIIQDGWLVSPNVFIPQLDRVRQIADLALTVTHRSFSEAFGEAWRPELVCFPYVAPQDTSSHRRIFGPHLQFEAIVGGFVCPAFMMQRTRRAADSLLLREARAHLDRLLALSELGTVERARQTIAWLLPIGLCSADIVAARLGLDRRTLHRHLAREGKSYATLVDEVRKDLARQQLADGRRALKEVAAALGFEASSAFSRWFHARFGCSASDWMRSAARRHPPG